MRYVPVTEVRPGPLLRSLTGVSAVERARRAISRECQCGHGDAIHAWYLSQKIEMKREKKYAHPYQSGHSSSFVLISQSSVYHCP
jgi:hypothetical protein